MRAWAALPFVLAASMAQAQTDFAALSAPERQIFHNEIRAVLLAHPDLVGALLPPAYRPPPRLYHDEVESDLALIARHRAALFAPDLPGPIPAQIQQRIALFTTDDCSPCATALDDLEALSPRFGLRVHVIDAKAEPALLEAMEADTLPFYVFPKMMLRGKMPAPVIERYLEQGLGREGAAKR
jgi:hypothetical protein